MTSDETSATPDHFDSLRAMKLQPGRDGMKEKGTNFKDNMDKVNKSQETLLQELDCMWGSHSSVVGHFLIYILALG